MTLQDCLAQFFKTHGLSRHYLIALSGGLDSKVLLNVCYELSKNIPLKLRAVHINHGISVNANEWAHKCKAKCEQFAIHYEEHFVDVRETKKNVEETARNARYAVFAKLLYENEILLTAHHQDDQAETMLLQLLRGAGPKGLSAMPMIKPFACGYHARPFLNISRQMINAYAHEKKLTWIEDESNNNIKLTRNLLRHKILPELKVHFPCAVQTITRSAKHFAEMQMLLDEYAQDEWQNYQGEETNTLLVSKLRLLTPAKQRLILRTWIMRLGFPLPNTNKMQTIQQQMLTAAQDKNPHVQWGQTVIRRYRDHLFLMMVEKDEKRQILNKEYQWRLEETLQLPGIGRLRATLMSNNGLDPTIEKATVAFRRGGEIINVDQRGHRRLKQLFQEWGVKPWERDRIPLIYVKDKLIAIIGYMIDPDFLAKKDKIGYQLSFEKEI